MKFLQQGLLALWALIPLFCGAQTYEGAKATVTFQIKNAGLAVDGSFMGFMGNILFSPADLDKTRLEGSVQVKTLSTGIPVRDRHLLETTYFDVDKHPTIHLQVVRIVKNGAAYRATCQLTLKGTTRQLDIPIELKVVDAQPFLTSTFTLNRLDYKVGSSNFFLSDKVKVTISAPLVLTRPL